MGEARRRKAEIAAGNFKGKSKFHRTPKIKFLKLNEKFSKLSTKEITRLYQQTLNDPKNAHPDIELGVNSSREVMIGTKIHEAIEKKINQ